MVFHQLNNLSNEQKEILITIWNSEYPIALKHHNLKSFNVYLAGLMQLEHTLVIDDKSNVMGWYFDFMREGERWFGMLLDSKVQGMGIGSMLLTQAKSRRVVLNGWVIDHNKEIKGDGTNYNTPINFYIKNNFEILENSRLELDNISAVKIRWEKK